MVERKKTREILPELGPGATYYRLVSALRSGKLDPPPAKDCSGDFAWTEADVEWARQALARDLRRKPGSAGKAVAHE
jgi:hypothetical protein